MGDRPDQPGEQAADTPAVPVDHRPAAADGREVAEAAVAERPETPTEDQVGNIMALLLGDGGDA